MLHRARDHKYNNQINYGVQSLRLSWNWLSNQFPAVRSGLPNYPITYKEKPISQSETRILTFFRCPISRDRSMKDHSKLIWLQIGVHSNTLLAWLSYTIIHSSLIRPWTPTSFSWDLDLTRKYHVEWSSVSHTGHTGHSDSHVTRTSHKRTHASDADITHTGIQ